MIDFSELETTLTELAQDPNWQTRMVKLRDALADSGITVVRTGGRNLGRCYNAEYFEVHSDKELSTEFLGLLRKIGMLGYGQEFWTKAAFEMDGKFIVRAESRVDSSD